MAALMILNLARVRMAKTKKTYSTRQAAAKMRLSRHREGPQAESAAAPRPKAEGAFEVSRQKRGRCKR